jgi:Protein of unknown function (DUF3306)
MSEREGFLRRWSRRKRELAEPAPVAAADQEVHARPESPFGNDSSAVEPAAAPEPLVDLAKLPPIESIAAATDIRPFLAPGVPAELTRAALRRAWAADPAIRDFIGLAENQWDFTAPGGAPGFGPLLETEQIPRMVAAIVGSGEPDPPTSGPPASRSGDSETPHAVARAADNPGAKTGALGAPTIAAPASDSEARRNNENAAPPKEGDGEKPQAPRRHGGALPQ